MGHKLEIHKIDLREGLARTVELDRPSEIDDVAKEFYSKLLARAVELDRSNEPEDATEDFYFKVRARMVKLDRPSVFKLWKYFMDDFFSLFGDDYLF